MPEEAVRAEGAHLRGTAIAIAFDVGLALLQLLFFAPTVWGGRALDLASVTGGRALFRVDGLGLAFGVAWTLGMALLLAGSAPEERVPGGLAALMTVGLLSVAYAREPLVFYLGWEVAGLTLWLG